MERQNIISSWRDRDISSGSGWEQAIDQHLETADIILLLISVYFLASDYYQRSLAILEKSLSQDHPNTKTVKNNLQQLQAMLNKTT